MRSSSLSLSRIARWEGPTCVSSSSSSSSATAASRALWRSASALSLSLSVSSNAEDGASGSIDSARVALLSSGRSAFPDCLRDFRNGVRSSASPSSSASSSAASRAASRVLTLSAADLGGSCGPCCARSFRAFSRKAIAAATSDSVRPVRAPSSFADSHTSPGKRWTRCRRGKRLTRCEIYVFILLSFGHRLCVCLRRVHRSEDTRRARSLTFRAARARR